MGAHRNLKKWAKVAGSCLEKKTHLDLYGKSSPDNLDFMQHYMLLNKCRAIFKNAKKTILCDKYIERSMHNAVLSVRV